MCVMLFCSFLSCHYTTTTWKCLISHFVEEGNTRQQLSFSFPELWYSPFEFNTKKFEVWGSTNSLFKPLPWLLLKFHNSVWARWLCWRSKTIKWFSLRKSSIFMQHFLLFTPPTWLQCTDSIHRHCCVQWRIP